MGDKIQSSCTGLTIFLPETKEQLKVQGSDDFTENKSQWYTYLKTYLSI